ncbi:hypothetical protein [Sphingobacterium spiritivorum]|uniref:hypothetical protein n=1 Tax=Sphingobacterium spiritivorum TaxID=258 RepID=UPI003DA63E14
MAVTITNYHCDACANGIVSVKTIKKGNKINFSFQDCNVCKKAFGLKRAADLTQVINTKKL